MRKPKYKLLSLKKVLSTILDDVKVQNEFTCGITLEQFNRFFDTYARKFEKTLTNNGKEYTLELFKAIQNQSISLVTKENFDPIPFHKSNKEGISTLLIPVLSILQSDRYKEIRIILSVTRLHESIRLEPELDLNPLFKPYDGEQELSVALEDYDSFLNVSPWASKIRLDHPKIKVSNLLSNRIRSGPNGQGVLTSHYDAVAVVNDEKLFKSLLRFNNILNQDTISQNLLWVANSCADITDKLAHAITGKIALSSERAGKTRLFSIGDYWTQSSLKPMHDWLMNILKTIPTDGTFDHFKAFERILKVKSSFMVSYDIKKFTCRSPLLFQTVMLSYLLQNRELAEHWTTIIGRRKFRSPDKKSWVWWVVGQPLGFYSSWAACTLFHHSLVKWSSFIHFKDHRPFSAYTIIGDDIVIWHQGVAEAYRCLLQRFGIEINMSKSKLYNSLNRKPIFEFAKRIAVANNEISGIPFDLLNNSTKSIYYYVDLIQYLVDTKLLIGDRVLALPDYLSSKGRFFLEILLWERSLGRSTWLESRIDNVFEMTSLKLSLRKQVAKVRIQGFQELIGKLDQLCYSSNLEQEMTKSGVAFSEMLIGYGGNFYHPIVLALNNVGMEMYETLPLLEAFEGTALEDKDWDLPELTKVEYLPLPYMKAHFERPGSKRNPERLKKHSQLVLTASQQLKERPYGFVLLSPKSK